MSHFTVIVALEKVTDLDEDLHKALAPFDEDLEVESYRKYEDGTPKDYWVYDSLKRGAEEHANGTGVYPYEPDTIACIRASGKISDQPEYKQRAEIEKKAALFHSLPAEPTWADMYRVMTEWFGEEGMEHQYDAETDRIYTDSTYNPESKWDWYQIGGRWTGYFKVKSIANRDDIINGEPGLMTASNRDVSRCDGGKKANLDLDGMRDEAAAEASAKYDRYHALVAGWPEAKPWSYFVRHVDQGDGSGYTIEQARMDYADQTRVKLVRDTEFDVFFGPDAIEEYAKPREVLVEQARASAVPGYAVLTRDGKWMAPGSMGWFGMSNDDEDSRAHYLEVANRYLDALPDDTWLIQVDCHI